MEKCGRTYDADAVNAVEPATLALLDLLQDELVKTLASTLLHSLEAEAEVDGERNIELVVRFEHVDPS